MMNYLTEKEKQHLEYKKQHHAYAAEVRKWISDGYIADDTDIHEAHLVALMNQTDPTAHYSDSASVWRKQETIDRLTESVIKARPDLKGRGKELLKIHRNVSSLHIPTPKYVAYLYELNDSQFETVMEYLKYTKQLNDEIQSKLTPVPSTQIKIAPTALGTIWSANLALTKKQQRLLDEFYLCYRKLEGTVVESPDFFRQLAGHYVVTMTPKKVEHRFLQVGELYIYLS